jgi:hypothetical protein
MIGKHQYMSLVHTNIECCLYTYSTSYLGTSRAKFHHFALTASLPMYGFWWCVNINHSYFGAYEEQGCELSDDEQCVFALD